MFATICATAWLNVLVSPVAFAVTANAVFAYPVVPHSSIVGNSIPGVAASPFCVIDWIPIARS